MPADVAHRTPELSNMQWLPNVPGRRSNAGEASVPRAASARIRIILAIRKTYRERQELSDVATTHRIAVRNMCEVRSLVRGTQVA